MAPAKTAREHVFISSNLFEIPIIAKVQNTPTVRKIKITGKRACLKLDSFAEFIISNPKAIEIKIPIISTTIKPK